MAFSVFSKSCFSCTGLSKTFKNGPAAKSFKRFLNVFLAFFEFLKLLFLQIIISFCSLHKHAKNVFC
ncbi:MAG: hypothetical protein ACKPKO_34415, partial [Candidatus Fonsibacter sp.]